MERVLELKIISCAALLVLAGCGVSPLGTAVIDAVIDGPDPQADRITVDRSFFEEQDLAALIVYSASSQIEAVGVAIQKRGTAITYAAAENRSIVMNGSLIQSTRGFGTNLQAVQTSADDPLMQQLGVQDWPERIERTYLFSGRGVDFEAIVVNCTVAIGEPQTVPVAGEDRTDPVVRENCVTDTGEQFRNTHLLDPQTGKIWGSAQWTGPIQGEISLQVIEPFIE